MNKTVASAVSSIGAIGAIGTGPPLLRGPPKYLDLIYFCNILVVSVMHLQIFLPLSLKIPKFSALRAICFPFSCFFSKFFLILSIYHITSVCMGARIILCLKLLENMTYIWGLQIFLAQGPQKAGHGTGCCWSFNFIWNLPLVVIRLIG